MDQLDNLAHILDCVFTCCDASRCQSQLEIITDKNCTNAQLRDLCICLIIQLNLLCDITNCGYIKSLQLDIVLQNANIVAFSNLVKENS